MQARFNRHRVITNVNQDVSYLLRGVCTHNLDLKSGANCGVCYVCIFTGVGTWTPLHESGSTPWVLPWSRDARTVRLTIRSHSHRTLGERVQKRRVSKRQHFLCGCAGDEHVLAGTTSTLSEMWLFDRSDSISRFYLAFSIGSSTENSTSKAAISIEIRSIACAD